MFHTARQTFQTGPAATPTADTRPTATSVPPHTNANTTQLRSHSLVSKQTWPPGTTYLMRTNWSALVSHGALNFYLTNPEHFCNPICLKGLQMESRKRSAEAGHQPFGLAEVTDRPLTEGAWKSASVRVAAVRGSRPGRWLDRVTRGRRHGCSRKLRSPSSTSTGGRATLP